MKQTTDPTPAARSESKSDTDRWNNRSLEQACERLVGALCMEWSNVWISDRRYLDMTDLKQNL